MIRRLMVILLASVICLLGTTLVSGQTFYNTLQEYEETTGVKIEKFNESPMLRARVAAGELPAVEKRLPEEPAVVEPMEEIGQYGGTWHISTEKKKGGADQAATWFFMENLLQWELGLESIRPHVAKRYDISNDGKVFTFYLRKGMKWSDGVPFTADDIMFWWEGMILNKEFTPIFPDWLVAGGEPMDVRKVDDYTVKFVFAVASPLWIKVFAKQYAPSRNILFPKHYLKQFHPDYTSAETLEETMKKEKFDQWYELFAAKMDWWVNPERPVVSAWKLTAPISPTGITQLERNPYYWEVDTAGNQLPYIDKVRTIFMTDHSVHVLKVISGEMDIPDSRVGSNIKEYSLLMQNREAGDYRVLKWPQIATNVFSLVFNLQHEDPVLKKIFRDRRFRIAMSHAINRQKIINIVYLGIPKEPSQPSPLPTSKYYYEPLAKAYIEYNPAKANQLLDEMGLDERDKDGYRLRPDGKRLSILIDVLTRKTSYVQSMEMIEKDWKAVGIDVAVKSMSDGLWIVRKDGAEFDMCANFSCSGGGVPLLQNYDFIPRRNYQWGDWYLSHGEEGEVPPPNAKHQMELYWQLIITVDEAKREELFRQILEIAAEDLYSLGVCHLAPGALAVKNRVRNVPDPAAGWTVDRNVGGVGVTIPSQFFIKE